MSTSPASGSQPGCRRCSASRCATSRCRSEVFRSLPFPGADVAANMFQYVAEVNDDYCRLRDVRLAGRLNPSLLGFDAWVARTRAPVRTG